MWLTWLHALLAVDCSVSDSLMLLGSSKLTEQHDRVSQAAAQLFSLDGSSNHRTAEAEVV